MDFTFLILICILIAFSPLIGRAFEKRKDEKEKMNKELEDLRNKVDKINELIEKII